MVDATNMQFSGMDGETPETFLSSDTDSSKWTAGDHAEAATAKDFLSDLRETYSGDELTRLAGMLATPIDDEGHGLGDSRLFVKAVARAAAQFNEVLKKREGGRDDGQPQIKFNMPVGADHAQRLALQREAQTILERELMQARSEFIKRTGRSLPGWWR